MHNELPPHHYQSVLKFMQATNQQNYDTALQLMKHNNFDLQAAVQRKLGIYDQEHDQASRTGSRSRSRNATAGEEGGEMGSQDDDQTSRMRRNQRVQEDVRRYMQFLRNRKNQSFFVSAFKFAKSLVVGALDNIIKNPSVKILQPIPAISPAQPKRHPAVNPPAPIPPVPQAHPADNFPPNSPNSPNSPNPKQHSSNNPKQSSNINKNSNLYLQTQNQSFILTGAISGQKQCNLINGVNGAPAIVVCRKNVFQNIEVISKFVGDLEIIGITVDRLNYAVREHQRLARRDRNLLVRYRNYLRKNYYGNRPGYLEQQQQQQTYQPETIPHSSLIHLQNLQYKKTQEESLRKKSLQLQQRQQEQAKLLKYNEVQQQRKARKMSIPDQPQTGELIRINFRCPDGNTITRNFDMCQKLELLYDWVQTNQQIEFQDNFKRDFQLMYGFPPGSLKDKRGMCLRDVFQSDQEKVMIREI